MKKLKGAAKRILGGLQNRLSKQARFGQSKHEAKQAAKAAYLKEHGNLDGYNPAKVDGIFSIGTMETYRAAMQPFAEWCSAHNVKNAGQITEAHAAAYLREREGAGLSPWTVSRWRTTRCWCWQCPPAAWTTPTSRRGRWCGAPIWTRGFPPRAEAPPRCWPPAPRS